MEKKVKTVLYKPPTGNPYLMKVRVKNTKYVKETETGQFEGRKRVKKGDDIKRNRVKKPFVLVRQSRTGTRGHLRKNREEHNPGEFF
jgi:hypothetical protein